MAKIKVNKNERDSLSIRRSFEFYYKEKFFNKWMNKFKFEGLNYQQIHYLMKKMWSEGTIACLKPSGIPNNLGIDLGTDSIIFTPYAPTDVYNIYDFPTKVLAINTRGVKFIPTTELEIDKDVVIFFCQKNHKSIYSTIEAKVNQLVDLEMTIRTNTKGQKMPWLFTTTPENRMAVKELVQGLTNDDPVMFTTLEDVDKSNALINGAPYVLDKLEQLRQKLEDDIMTVLGGNNVGIAEKKEHLIVDEVNANNQEIQDSNDDFESIMNENFERVSSVLGYKASCSLAHEQKMTYNKYDKKEESYETNEK